VAEVAHLFHKKKREVSGLWMNAFAFIRG
jgi:hypothetical protein